MNSNLKQTRSMVSNDEILSLYLQDRDTPCPGCGYNRKDSTTPKCPECGLSISLFVAPIHHDRNTMRMGKAFFWFIAIFSAFQAGEYVYDLIFRQIIGGGIWSNGVRTSSSIMIGGAILWTSPLILSIKQLLSIKKRKTQPSIKQTLPLMALTITLLTLQATVWIIFNWIYW